MFFHIWLLLEVQPSIFQLRCNCPTYDFILCSYAKPSISLEISKYVGRDGTCRTPYDNTQHTVFLHALPTQVHNEKTGRKEPLLKIMSFILNVHSFSLFMLEFVSKHTVILIHGKFNMLGLRRLNFLMVLHPRLQGFVTNAQALLPVKPTT